MENFLHTQSTNLIGLFGTLMLSFCGIPQALKSIKEKSSKGVSLLFLLMWLFGEVFVFYYVMKTSLDFILLANYLLNIVLVTIILFYKIPFKRK